MPKISYVHGLNFIPPFIAGEMSDRGRLVTKTAKPYIPYTNLSYGEMKLYLLREQAAIFAAAFPEIPTYSRAVAMIDNALNKGVSNGVQFIGAIPDDLQGVASEISKARFERAPAAGDFFGGRSSLSSGVRIGDPIVPDTYGNCDEWAANKANAFYGENWSVSKWKSGAFVSKAKRERFFDYVKNCITQKALEKILNDRLETASHHVLYKDVNPGFPPLNGSRMDTKRLLHTAGIQSLGHACNVADALINEWTEVGILRKNAAVGVGPLPSVQSGFYVAGNGNAAYNQYMQWKNGQGVNAIGEPISATVLAIITAVGSALAAAAKILAEFNQIKLGAMSAAQGFGTTAYSAEKNDLVLKADQGGGMSNNTLLLLAAGGAALYMANK